MSENLPRVGSALIVKDEANRILLGKRNKDPQRGNWILPGGKIHAFESIAEAAARELAEETGLTVEVQNQFRVYEVINSPEEHRIVIYSWARATGGTLRASDDVSEVRFVSLRELGDLPLTPLVKQVLADAGYISESLPFAAEKNEDESPCLFAMPIAGAIQGTRTSEGDTRMMDELQAKCGALLMDIAAAKKERDEARQALARQEEVRENMLSGLGAYERQVLSLEKLADERVASVEYWQNRASYWKDRGAQFIEAASQIGVVFSKSADGIKADNPSADERGREVERLRAALETVGEELSVMYGRYEPTGSPSEDYAQMSEGLRIAREALAATLPAESADQEADRLMSVIKRQQDRLDRQSAALRGMNEQVVSGLAKNKSLQRSMKNVFMLAKRELSRTKPREASKSKEIWGHLHRLCIEAGCESSILRNATPGGQPDTEVVVPFDEDEPCMCERCEADRASSTTPTAMPPAHVYTSTACQHGLHDRCRKACKFCGVACACSCHATEATPPAQKGNVNDSDATLDINTTGDIGPVLPASQVVTPLVQEQRVWMCRFHPTDWFHEVGCPHMTHPPPATTITIPADNTPYEMSTEGIYTTMKRVEPAQEHPHTAGISLVAIERNRQISAEGWTPDHDSEHVNHELSKAAICYARTVECNNLQEPFDWPWDSGWWRPSTDPVRNLVKAGALIVAEIDRIIAARTAPASAPSEQEK